MSDTPTPKIITDRQRPKFPKRAVITGGMPYGNKDLHFGHIGGVFVQADTFARFLRDRIGKDSVIFVSGTDCYGSPIVVSHREQKEAGDFDGTLLEFVEANHERQKETLKSYCVEPNNFAASGFGRNQEVHEEIGALILETLHKNGHLTKLTTPQFYDAERQTYLNGRQVVGRCPIQGCKSEKAYADECSLGHQFEPKDLIAPKSTLTGNPPEMRDVTNWYINLPAFRDVLKPLAERLKEDPLWRPTTVRNMLEYFEPPIVHITKDQIKALEQIQSQLPEHEQAEGRGKSLQLIFKDLEGLQKACSMLGEHSIRYRSGKTVVPFRMTGNLEWGLKAPELDGLNDLTFWVWPESLWAPISFCAVYLEQNGANKDAWKNWWCSKEAQVYQFIGEDNVFFYSLPEFAMFFGMQGENPVNDPPEGEIQLPILVANHHLLFLDKKASSSGKVKPPMASDLLEYYTVDQLRIHFLSLGLGMRSVSFRPKPLNPTANEKEGDPVLKDGNLLSNAFNRAVRSCFYTAQKFTDGKIPVGEVSSDLVEFSEKTILDFEAAFHHQEFHQGIDALGKYIRDINSRWSKSQPYKDDCDPETRKQALVDAFHMVRVTTTLLHSIAPVGTEKVREYFQVSDELWNWDKIFEPIYAFMDNPETHELKFLEPRIDFFEKHQSQFS